MGDQDDVEKHSSQGFAQDFSCMNNRGPQAAQVIPVTVSPQNIDSTTDGEGGELNPQDAWLPLTESRKGTSYSATFHLLSSGIGIQALLLPVAFATLGCGREEVQQHISRRISMWSELRGQSL
ncbi:hypothetical protein RchiOBHm_Chr2g0160371 [Rosa chinensis]|uniref:Amino acid transporter, transmembrane domain-containing protein n=1 Tax=Rosa chinensis TaxID=74649 RepID=A0A2P6S2G4_ROSCH|nr:hypothetical protein RchiOBHm_Chr2g0160371 [Rosa chinensis]